LDAVLKNLDVFTQGLGVVYAKTRRGLEFVYDKVDYAFHKSLGVEFLVENWLLYSTIASLFMGTMLTHKGVDIFYGYPIVVLNTAILLALNRLVIHRNHAIFVGAVMLISLIAAKGSGTSVFSVAQQILGSLVFSVYYFSMLTTYGISVPRWMKLYTNAALLVGIWGIIDYIARTLHIFNQTNQTRLHSILPEPSFFVYLTLPAVAVYVNAQLRSGGYRVELAIFALCYYLADSALGYIGLLFIAYFAFLPKLNFWRMCGFVLLASGAFVGLFYASGNFRQRVVDTFLGIVLLNLQHVNTTTYALLSNVYVTVKTFIKHPLIGVGIGGYANAYSNYASDPALQSDDPQAIGFNMYDASSLFLRVAAELGLVGLVALIGFLIVCARVKGPEHVAIRNALVPFFLIRMGRYGAYFSLDLYFFVGLYVLNYLHYRHKIRQGQLALEAAHG
jgi:hypothetical protein